MSFTYTTYLTRLANLAVMETDNVDFVAILPAVIDYAEQRIYRELNLLSTVTRDSSANLTANSREFTPPSSMGRFVSVNAINVVTPVGSLVANGTRNPLIPASLPYIDLAWPSNTAASVTTIPTLFAMVSDQTVILGSPPGAAFNAEVIGTIRPTPLSVSNTTTYLTLYLPDLFLAASMIFVSGWQKNFGSQADDPKMAVSWESQFQTLFQSANGEEIRKRYASGAWLPPPAQ